jgi:signal transduction histidine kinase/DNA-binding response OmpR family regulator
MSADRTKAVVAPMIDPERVLVLAPTSTDAELTRTIMADANLACHICADLESLAESFSDGAGAILLTEEVVAASDANALVQALASQPPWSEVPIVLLAGAGVDSSVAAWAMELLGNVTVLERPVRMTTLISALRTAIRARRRQYELRNQLVDLTHAEASLRRQSERLRLLWEAASVLLTTAESNAMMRTLFSRIGPHLQLDAYFNCMLTDTGEVLRLESYEGISQEEARKISQLESGRYVRGKATLEQQPIVATCVQQSDDPAMQMIKDCGIRAYACIPLIADGRLLGTLSFASRRRDQFDADDVEFLRTICHYVTVAYERMRFIHQLRDSDRRKDEFLATLAHELRNPLAPIRSALQIIRLTGNDGPAIAQARTMMERQLGQMVRLIDDLLDVSRISRGKLELRKDRIELASVIRSAVDTSRPLIDAAGHELTLSVTAEPIYLDADPVRLAQVFSNLLNNAAKYMESGGHIWLTTALGDKEVVVTVRDTGIGIPADALPAIFDMFTQVDRSLEKSQGGLGIGLTLVKQLVELHGGKVEARSEGEGKGAEFIMHLPVVSLGPAPQPKADDEQQARAPACRILVADDNRDAAESMGMMLRLMGNEVRTVQDGVQAVEEAAEFRPDVILLDIGMPRLNGYDAARRIRGERWGKDIVLVALTGWGQEEDKHHASEAGFDHHFTKPVNPADLERLVAGLHAGTSLRDRLTQS